MKGSEYAFPFDNGTSMLPELGLTKRELFAAMAMQGMLTSDKLINYEHNVVAADAMAYADALLAALGEKGGE